MKNKIIYLFVVLASFSLSSCATMTSLATGEPTRKFEIIQVDDKFNEDQQELVIGDNNKLSNKSVYGGMCLGGKGIYLNPFYSQDSKSLIGFQFFHYAYKIDDLFAPIRKIIFISNGKKIVLDFSVKNYDFGIDLGSWNTISNDINMKSQERAYSAILLKEFNAICNSSELEVRLIGKEHSLDLNSKDVSKWKQNLIIFKTEVLDNK